MNRLSLGLFITLSTATLSCRTANNSLDASSIKGYPAFTAPVAGIRFVPVTTTGVEFDHMQETEMTRGQWKDVMKGYPEQLPGWSHCADKEKTIFEDSYPVTCVSPEDVSNFITKFNQLAGSDNYIYSLPRAVDYDYAVAPARDKEIAGSNVAWCDAASMQPVGKKQPFDGIYDLVGNVWELTNSFPRGVNSARGERLVIRGGGWNSGPNYSKECNQYTQGSVHYKIGRDVAVGFRLIRKRK